MKSRIKISGVAKKREGLNARLRPWSLWEVYTESGVVFKAWDGVIADRAFRNVGQFAAVEYDADRVLTSLTIERSGEAA